MSPRDLEAYLHRHIPLSAAMFVRVREATPERVILAAPLVPNLNHQSTAFGGSVAALGILAGWTLVHVRLRREGLIARTVIQRSDVRYLEPVRGAFEAVTEAPDERSWTRFLRALDRRGRARVRLDTRILQERAECALLDGSYVSFGGEPD